MPPITLDALGGMSGNCGLAAESELLFRVLAGVVGKRITYRVLTAKNDAGFMGLK